MKIINASDLKSNLKINSPREIFLDYLLSHSCTRKQAEEFLTRKNFNDINTENLLHEAQQIGLIDDLAYAELFAEGHLHWGNLKIAYELKNRGVEKNIIAQALNNIQSENERAKNLYENWIHYLDEKKITARLISRGFSKQAVRSLNDNDGISF